MAPKEEMEETLESALAKIREACAIPSIEADDNVRASLAHWFKERYPKLTQVEAWILGNHLMEVANLEKVFPQSQDSDNND